MAAPDASDKILAMLNRSAHPTLSSATLDGAGHAPPAAREPRGLACSICDGLQFGADAGARLAQAAAAPRAA